MKDRLRRVWIAPVVLILVGGPAAARTWRVPGDAPTVAAGLSAAVAGDTVLLACGNYQEHDLAIGSGVTLRGETGDPNCVTIDAGRQGRILDVSGAHPAAVVEGLTITGGWVPPEPGDGLGGGIRCSDSELTVDHCNLTRNCAPFGGGIGAVNSAMAISFCTFAADSAAHAAWGAGGGLYCRTSSGSVRNCAFTRDVARGTAQDTPGDGGALFSQQSTLVLSDDSFSNNVAGGGAGALYSYLYDKPTITGCTFSGNSGGWGGAAYCELFSTAAFHNCTFVWNTAQAGGALLIDYSQPTVADCTLASNVALAGAGGGALCWNASFRFQRCFFFGNRAQAGGGGASLGGFTDFDGCVFADNTSGGAGGAIEVQSGATQVTGCTLIRNTAPAGAGLRCLGHATAVVERSILCFATSGGAVSGVDPSPFSFTCSDVYGNAGGDWTGPIAAQADINGNISADPLFCGDEAGDYHLASNSLCAPANQVACGGIGAYGVGCTATSVAEPPPPAGVAIVAARCFPNPFNPRATIAFELRDPEPVRVGIYALDGRLVRALFAGWLGAGAHELVWDGRDGDGAALASGSYVCRLRAGAGSVTRKMVLLR